MRQMEDIELISCYHELAKRKIRETLKQIVNKTSRCKEHD